jgi:hypothetical protein
MTSRSSISMRHPIAVAAWLALSLSGVGASAQPEVIGPILPTETGALRDLPPAEDYRLGDPILEIPKRTYPRDGGGPALGPVVLQPTPGEPQDGAGESPVLRESRAFSTPLLNFAGQGFSGVNPPDTVGDVGPNHYVQMINGGSGATVTIYDKTGGLLAGPFAVETLGTGVCATGLGDPIVLYDRLADRWLLSEFSQTANALCVYISQTPDPTGAYFAYQFPTPGFPDYPKYGVWPDAYYVSTNEADPAAYAMDRTQMLAGAPATMQRFVATDLAGFGFQALIPSDLDGAVPPPAGAPNYFMRHRDDEAHNPGANDPTQDFLEIWEFHVDFVTPVNSTFTGPTNIAVSEFDSDLCGLVSFNCFPQPAPGPTLDPLREVVMWRLQYRNDGATQTLVGNLVTDVDGTDHGGIRWFELNNGGAGWGLNQEGTYSPDANHRWMGSIAMDKDGNVALGFSESSTTLFPQISYTGRLATDPPGTLPQGEFLAIAGTGASGSNRWGDYSAMSVDPADDCTFWYTNEYATAGAWATQVTVFKFDSCGGVVPAHACCNTGGPGCVDATIEAAVCGADPFCCDTEWDNLCVDEVTTVAGDNCDCCTESPEAEGCYDPAAPGGPNSIAECVCLDDPYCCTDIWDDICVGEVDSLGCGMCAPPDCTPVTTFTVSSGAIPPGGIGDVDVTTSNPLTVGSSDIVVNFDPSLLQATTASSATLSSFTFFIDNVAGTVATASASAVGDALGAGGTLFTVTFENVGIAPGGMTSVTLSDADGDACDDVAGPVPPIPPLSLPYDQVPGDVLGGVLGDVSCDGALSPIDAAVILGLFVGSVQLGDLPPPCNDLAHLLAVSDWDLSGALNPIDASITLGIFVGNFTECDTPLGQAVLICPPAAAAAANAATSAAPEQEARVRVGREATRAGRSVTIAVTTRTALDVGSTGLSLSYDPSALEVVSVESELDGFTYHVEGGAIHTASAGLGQQLRADDELLSVTFQVRADAARGRHAVTLIGEPLIGSSVSGGVMPSAASVRARSGWVRVR